VPKALQVLARRKPEPMWRFRKARPASAGTKPELSRARTVAPVSVIGLEALDYAQQLITLRQLARTGKERKILCAMLSPF
jgi:hypothetical protein